MVFEDVSLDCSFDYLKEVNIFGKLQFFLTFLEFFEFFIALFPAERAPDEDDDKGAGSGDNRSTKKYHVRTFSSVLLVAQCSNNACLN